jgi:glucokinase
VKRLGIDIGATFIKLCWDGGKEKIRTPERKGELRELLDRIIEKIAPREAGIAVAGLINKKELKVEESPNLRFLEGFSFRFLKEKVKRLEVFNDATAAAFGEFKGGAGRGSRVFVCITLGTGLGGGLVIEGKPFEGVSGGALEPGHTTVEVNGWMCSCGRKGCLEAYASSYGLERHYRELWGEEKSSFEIVKEAKEGKEKGVRAIKELSFYLGAGITNLVHLFNPDRVAITGGIVARCPELVWEVERTVSERSFKSLGERCRIVAGELSDFSGAVGACLLLESAKKSGG